MVNPAALSDLVWAEDGLFPLCIQNYGYFSCLTDPFAGYLLFLSRTLAWPVSLFPVSTWPTVTNVVSAAAIGLGCGFITWLLVRANVSRAAAALAGVIPVLIPIVGFEAVNASGSAYMILLIIAAILVSFSFTPQLPIFVAPMFLLISALTIPSSFVLALPIFFFVITQPSMRRRQILNLTFLGIGLAFQLTVIVTAENSRAVAITIESLTQWVSHIPVAAATLIPLDTQLAGSGMIESTRVPPNQFVGFIFLAAVIAIVSLLVLKGTARQTSSGLLIMVGILMGLVPAITGYSNNRYFVIPLVAILIAVVIIFDSLFKSRRNLMIAPLAAVLVLLWVSGFDASEFRSEARPPWAEMLASIEDGCRANPSGDTQVTFSPDWPFSGAIFLGPTSNLVSCEQLTRSS